MVGALVLGEVVVVGFFLITNSVKEDQEIDFKFKPTFIYIALAHLADAFVQSDLLMRQFDLTTFSSPQPPLPRLIYVNPDKIN